MMITKETVFRVSYSDTDQMGFMHHSNYLKYYETARWELFRSIGIPYNEIEEEGVILPVITASVRKSTGKACFPPKRISDTLKELTGK